MVLVWRLGIRVWGPASEETMDKSGILQQTLKPGLKI